MKLILVRHGDAGAYTLPDNERNLSKLGQAQAWATGEFLATYLNDTKVDLLISSPYNRADQTAKLIAKAIDYQGKQVICPSITPDDNPKQGLLAVAGLIEEAYNCVIVVCHMPIVAYMSGLLTDKDESGFGLAEVRVVEMASVGLGQGVQIAQFCPNV